MKIYKLIVTITVPIFILMLFASILTTKQYLLVSKGVYSQHAGITFNHEVAADKIMGYLNYRYDELQYQFEDGENAFNDDDISHMVDVKVLYTNLRITALLSLVAGIAVSVVIYKKDKKAFYETFKAMYLWPMFFVLFVGGYVLIDFGAAFEMFHKMFFTGSTWLLENDSTLIQLLPTNFWMVSGLIILLCFSVSMGLITFYATKKAKMYH